MSGLRDWRAATNLDHLDYPTGERTFKMLKPIREEEITPALRIVGALFIGSIQSIAAAGHDAAISTVDVLEALLKDEITSLADSERAIVNRVLDAAREAARAVSVKVN